MRRHTRRMVGNRDGVVDGSLPVYFAGVHFQLFVAVWQAPLRDRIALYVYKNVLLR